MSKLILIVDDNESFGMTMKKILERKGYEVIYVNNGHKAIDIVKRNQSINLVFMDIKMPEINGVEVLRELLKIREDLPVVMMTAYALDDLIRESRLLGACGVLSKPVDFDQIFTIIDATKPEEKVKILVVDDDESTRKSFHKILSTRGYEVVSVESGEEALSLVDSDTTIVFIDIRLPNMNGFETFAALRKKYPELVVIFMTGYFDEESDRIRDSLKDSASTYFEKPLDMLEVFNTIEDILSNKVC